MRRYAVKLTNSSVDIMVMVLIVGLLFGPAIGAISIKAAYWPAYWALAGWLVHKTNCLLVNPIANYINN